MLHMIPEKLVDAAANESEQSQASDDARQGNGPVKLHKVPRRVRLGSETIVQVKLVSPEKMKTVSPGGLELFGLWDECNKIIYIDKTSPLDKQWEILRHELLHAIIDIDHEVRLNTK